MSDVAEVIRAVLIMAGLFGIGGVVIAVVWWIEDSCNDPSQYPCSIYEHHSGPLVGKSECLMHGTVFVDSGRGPLVCRVGRAFSTEPEVNQ